MLLKVVASFAEKIIIELMKIIVIAFLFVFFASGCAHVGSREPAASHDKNFCSYLPPKETLGNIVRKNDASAKYCPQISVGHVCLMSWSDAMRFCQTQGLHLPTSRDFACLLPQRGTVTLEFGDMPTPILPGYYLVDSQNPGGVDDRFYMNHDAYKRPSTEKEDHSIWTASLPPDHPGFAHVYFDKWGGGGLDPKYPTGEDHRLTHLNSVQCVEKQTH